MSYHITTYDNDKDLIISMLSLYNNGRGVDVDPCYSKGVFWKGLEQPTLKFDLVPQVSDVVQADCTMLPLDDSSINSIMFDPPFIIGQGKSTTGIMRKRFSAFYNVNEQKTLYFNSLMEFRRILRKGGRVFFKCQDTVTSGKQLFSHVNIINDAYSLGFEPLDLFILVRKRGIMDPKWKAQRHAKKTHSYYIVLEKK